MSAVQLSIVKPAVLCNVQRKNSHRAVNAFTNTLTPRMLNCKSVTRPLVAKHARRQVRVYAEDASTTTGAGVVTDESFEDLVLKSPVPVLVDFWAPWCGPCRMIAPLIDEIAGEYGDRIKAVKLNTDESPGVATEYGIRSIPTVMVFKGGQKLDTVIGAVPKATLIQTLEKYLD